MVAPVAYVSDPFAVNVEANRIETLAKRDGKRQTDVTKPNHRHFVYFIHTVLYPKILDRFRSTGTK